MKEPTKKPFDVEITTIQEIKAVLVKVPKRTGLEWKETETFVTPSGNTYTVSEHYHNALNYVAETDSAGGIFINRYFRGILPSEDCGKLKIFDVTINKVMLDDGRWFLEMCLQKTARKIAKHEFVFLPKYHAGQGKDMELDYTGRNWMHIAGAPTHYCTCGACGERIYMTHKPNPKFAGKNYRCPNCLPRKPREKKSKEQRQRESGLRELQELKTLYNRMGH